jgi:hypothetical protein
VGRCGGTAQGFYAEADTLFIRGFTSTNLNNYAQFRRDVDDFDKRLTAWVNSNMAPAAKSRIIQYNPSYSNLQIKTAINDDHRQTLVILLGLKDAIDALMKSNAYDKAK